MSFDYPDIAVFVIVLLALVASFNIFVTGWKNLQHLRKPTEDLEDAVKRHDELLGRDKSRLDTLEESNRLIMRAMLQLITHEVDGNHTEQLKNIRDEMQHYLINR